MATVSGASGRRLSQDQPLAVDRYEYLEKALMSKTSDMQKTADDLNNHPMVAAEDRSACFRAPHCMFLLFVFSDIVRRTPSANPAAEAMKSKIA